MNILDKITRILFYPSWFGYIFGTMCIFICFGMYLKSTWHDTAIAQKRFIIISLICLAIGIINIPLTGIVKANADKGVSGTGAKIYDEITEYAHKIYGEDYPDAITSLRDDLKTLSEGYNEGYSDSY